MSEQEDTIMGNKPKVIFWTVFVVVLVPSAWFVGSSYIGLQSILEKLDTSQSAQTVELLKELRRSTASQLSVNAHLEYDTLWNRQGRTNSFLATRTWLRFMCSIFGAILIFSGAVYLLCRIELKQTEVGTEFKSLKVSILTSSPGIIMLLIGAGLMVTPNMVDQPIETKDGAVFLMPMFGVAANPDPASQPDVQKLLKDIVNGDG